MTHSTKDIAPARRIVFAVLGLAQAALAFLAFWDLAHRSPRDLHGPKQVWVPIILINWVGPLAYFVVHRTR